MSINKFQSFQLPLLFLITAIVGRFVSIAGLSPEEYGRVLIAYFSTDSRSFIFLIQYIGLVFVFIKLLNAQPQQIKLIVIATFLLFVVSIARYFVPIFLISILGDTLVIWWLLTTLRETHAGEDLTHHSSGTPNGAP
jgi:hypothetical protein